MQKALICSMILVTLAGGCRLSEPQEEPEYRTVAVDPRRDTQTARQHNARAVGLIKQDDLDDAEKALKTALAADTFFGPAHNNLGLVYYRREKFYLAAWEFQYAAKLMPGKAEPRHNLGMVLETVGKLDEAADWYEKALAIEPDRPEVVASTARLYVRSNRKDARTRQLLGEVVMKDQRPQWVSWARDRLAAMGGAEGTAERPAVPADPQ